MKKGLGAAKLIAAVTCVTLLFTSPQSVSAATGVQTSIDVSSTVTSSASISEQTAYDEYQVRDDFYSLDDSSVNRATSEHFQIIWGNGDTTGTVNYDFIKGNLINLENIRTFYVEKLGMKDIGTSQYGWIDGLYKTNVYVSGTGLSVFEDDWAYMSVDSDGFGYLFVAPGAMRVDEPSWVIPHELAHVFTYHQGGTISGAWYEATANWFRDQYLGSEYYAYGGNTYGPTSDFFAPYMINSSYHVPHMLNWYDTWPLLLYISENPDNIDGLGMELIHKIFEYDGANASMYDLIENLSGVSIKTVLGGMTRRLATMDFSRQEHYLNRLHNETLTVSGNYEKIYTTLNSADSEGWQSVPSDRAPMQTGFNIIPLDVDLSKDKLTVDFVSTSSASGADFRTSIVTSTASNYTRYSDTISGNGSAEIMLNGDETAAYLVVCATPDTLETFNVDWNSQVTDASTRFTYKVKVLSEDEQEIESEESETEESTTQPEEPETEESTTQPEEPEIEESTTQPEESETEESTTQTPDVKDNGCTGKVSVVSNWGAGLNANVVVENNGNEPVNGWTIEFDFSGEISNLWCAKIVSHVGSHYVIEAESYNAYIPVNGYATFGFGATINAGQTGNVSNIIVR